MRPLVSIVIPCYNSERYLEESLLSVIAQTYENIEIVVVDDGSTDTTPAIISRHTGDARVCVVSQSNKGLAAARNAGLAASKGDYITFLDSDDIYMPSKIERQVAFLAEYPDAGLAYCRSGHFLDADPARVSYAYNKSVGATEPILRRLMHGNFINVNTAMVKKPVLDAVGGFDPKFRIGEDWDLWIRLAQSGCVFVEQPEMLVATRLRDDSLRSDLVLQKKNDIRIYEKNFHERAPLAYRIRLGAARLLSAIPAEVREQFLGYYRMHFVYRNER